MIHTHTHTRPRGRYCLLCMVRFFTSFGAQPRLAVVTRTLEAESSRIEGPDVCVDVAQGQSWT